MTSEMFHINFIENHVIKGEVCFRINDRCFIEQYTVDMLTKEVHVADFGIPDSWKYQLDKVKDYIETQVIEYADTHKH